MRSSTLALPLMSLALAAASPAAGQAQAAGPAAGAAEPRLWYFGRASVKIRTASGFVVYIDPYAPGDYSEPADLVLVTHGHGDHNAVGKTKRKPGAAIVAPPGAVQGPPSVSLAEGEEGNFGPVQVRALPAANKNHPRGSGVGYLLAFEGIVLYHSGDTSYFPEMAGFAKFGIAWALLPCDGFYNMGPEEAARSALTMKARRLIPIHSSKDGLFDEKNARAPKFERLVVLEPGQALKLEP